MKKITSLLVLAALCLNFCSRAQSHRPLAIGDTLPDVPLTKVLNYNSGTVRLAALKGKIIVLDFWATWCSSCIKEFPKNYALQQKLKDDLFILGVNSKSSKDSRAKVLDFFKRHEQQYVFPSILEDTLLTALFPHATIPHYVWIKDNMVVGITEPEQLTEAAIKRLLKERGYHLPVKQKIDHVLGKPLFLNKDGVTPSSYLLTSVLTPYVEGLETQSYFLNDEHSMVSRIQLVNYSRLALFQTAFPAFGSFAANRWIVEAAQPSNFATDSNSMAWNTKNRFVYEASFTPRTRREALEILRQDLGRYFKLSIDTQYRSVEAIIIRKGPSDQPVPKAGEKSETNLFEMDGQPIYLRNYSFEDLIDYLNTIYTIPILNETGISGNVNLNLPANLREEIVLLTGLQQGGFTVQKEVRKVKFVILREGEKERHPTLFNN